MLSTTRLVWPAIEASAEPGLRAELTPRVARGTARLTLGYSEPDGGSDIAGAKTRAVRDGDEWVINGQKIFTTNAQHSQYTFLITRTDPDLPKHQGLTMFLCPLDTPGIEIQALPTIGDERTNIVYYSDVRISDRYRVGEVNSGWAVLHGPLDAEHYIGGEASKLQDISGGAGHLRWLRRGVQAAARWAQDNQDSGGSAVSTDPVFLAGLGRILVQIEAALATPGPMGRIKGADVAIAGCEQLIDLTGPAATLPAGADGAIDHGVIELAHRAVQVTATYGGTVEVFRTVVAQHYLGLPRPDYPGHKTFLSVAARPPRRPRRPHGRRRRSPSTPRGNPAPAGVPGRPAEFALGLGVGGAAGLGGQHHGGRPAIRRASQAGARRGGRAPSALASTGSQSRTGAGSSSTML